MKRSKGKKPLHIQPYNPFGPSSLRYEPLDTVKRIRKETGKDIFTVNTIVWGIGSKITYVLGVKNTRVVTTSPNEVLSFEAAYKPFLLGAFGYGVLDSQTCPRQVGLLNKYLKSNLLPIYITASYALAKDTLATLIPQHKNNETNTNTNNIPIPAVPSSSISISSSTSSEEGEYKVVNLQNILLQLSFKVGVRNLLGEECLSFLKDFDYKDTFDAFELSTVIRNLASEYSPIKFKKVTEFDRVVDKLIDSITMDKDCIPKNPFQDMVKEKDNPEGYTLGKKQVLKNLTKTHIFGSSFNGYNTLCFLFRKIINDPNMLLRLKKEQLELSEMPISQVKLNKMIELKKELSIVSLENSFPFLLRRVMVDDFVIDGYHIPKGHIISFSPTMVHEDQNINNSPDTERELDLVFGADKHLCPAKPYAINSMLLIASTLLSLYDFKKKEHLTNPVNKRMVTFPHQSPMEVYIRRMLFDMHLNVTA